MSPRRAHTTALTLVNWKGVFFEHYWLDRHVTALEGANGAGKTTVMIAAYVVLLPDLTRLRFVNLGETGPSGSDRGIWGRLGDEGPSYSALEVDPGDGTRVTLGVYLERKAAPSLSLTPFVISGAAAGDSARRLFLDEQAGHEQVSSLQEIQRKAKASGLAIDVFASSKDYFAHLFERGISPLRLGTDEDKSKWNEMLRTSMTGGISRTLTTDLRSFLFRQESGLSDTLSRMHKNLDACRRTRIEVGEARTLEHEVTGVASAARAMLEAVIEACREQTRESRERRERAEQRHASELASASELGTRLAEAELRRETIAPRLARAILAETQAAEQLAAVERALSSARRAAELEAERERLAPAARAALEHKASASSERQRAKVVRDTAQQTLLVAANGLGSWQAGLDELHRQANAHRRLRTELRRAQEELARLLDDTVPLGAPGKSSNRERLARVQSELALGRPSSAWAREACAVVRATIVDLDRARAEGDRDAELAERRRAARAEASAALSLLTGAPLEGDLRARAELELTRLAELELAARRLPELRAEWQRQSALEVRRRALRAELEALGLPAFASAAELVAHLSELEAALRQAEQARREHEQSGERAARGAERLRERISELETRSDTYVHLADCAARSLARGVQPPATRADLNAALRANDEARHVLAVRAAGLAAQSRDALERALECEATLAPADVPMAELAELCDGQLLAAHYDDLDPEAARRVQAELGPLADAIIVVDPERAAAQIIEHEAPKRDIWLLRPGAELPAGVRSPAASAASEGAHVVVDMGYGLRLSPLPEIATLGRAARRGRAEALRAEAEAASRASADLSARQRDERAARAELEALQDHWEVWVHGDPRPELERVRAELAALLAVQSEADRLGREQRLEIARREARRDALRAQLPSHHLLDPPERPDSARTSLEAAEHAAAELARTASARKTLLARIHDLDGPGADGPGVAEWQRKRAALDEQRHRAFVVAEALELVASNEAALAWSEAEAAIAERAALVPELEAQHRRAERELALAQEALDAAEATWERATESAQTSAAALSALEAHVARARAEVAAQGVTNPDATALEHARSELGRCAEACAELRRAESLAHAEVALCGERASEAERRARAAARELELQREREPAAPHWQELADAAREVDAWATNAPAPAAPDLEEREPQRPDARGADPRPGSAERWLAARAKCELLGERLSRARGGAQLAENLARALSPALTPAAGEELARFFSLWNDVKSWLARRLPAPLAELGEPLVGLARLETDLAELERRLERQEGELRGTSGDIARSIDVQLRRASTQLRRLNHSLDGVRFGSIHAIRVRMERAVKMERILAALRDGETQELLFQSNLPIEAALDEVFRRYAGGRTGGQRLLDFREYIELGVEIQRRPDQAWERVSASQVSTGEAIGIGAALMMVILTEWEKSDQLLRRPRQNGSLRFLFLDEANRLSQDNLGVLFDLCQSLDLQLLIAAPEVARAEGNTTYRLVRRVSDDGREEVLVTGRRASLPGAPAWSTTPAHAAETRDNAAPEPAAAEQVALFGE